MLLSSVEDEDVALWMARIQEYHVLLQAQSVSFDVTKVAAIRLGLLRNRALELEIWILILLRIDISLSFFMI